MSPSAFSSTKTAPGSKKGRVQLVLYTFGISLTWIFFHPKTYRDPLPTPVLDEAA
jgi:hypothetical protein